MWPFPTKQPQIVQAKFDVAQTTAENRRHWANADTLAARAAASPAVRKVVRIRSRYESENNSWYRGMLRTAVNHIVGKGPRLQILTDNPAVNTRIETAFRRWTQSIGFAIKLRTMVEAYWRDGEVFAMRADRPKAFPIALDIWTFEADQIASPWFEPYDEDHADDGIRFDQGNNETEVYIYDQHPGENTPLSTLRGKWYPAEEVLHLFRSERPGQTRGIPRVTASLQTLPIMRRQELATLYSAETAANFAMYLKSNSAALDPSASPADFAEIEIARNMLTTLPAGWEVGQIEPKQPGPLYEMFQRQALQSFARCTNMPYALAAGTGRDSNFSSLKGDMKNVWQPEVEVEQDDIETMIVEPIFQWFMEAAVFARATDPLTGKQIGLLDDAPPYSDIEHHFQWPPLPELDAIVAAKAAVIRLESGQSSDTEEAQRRGQDHDTLTSRAAQDAGVDVKTWKQAVFNKRFGVTPDAPPEPGAAPAADGGKSVQQMAMNGAQIASLLAIVEQVSAGTLPPLAAMNVMRSSFPSMSTEMISAILDPITAPTAPTLPDGTPNPEAVTAAPVGEYTELGQRAFTNNQKRIVKTLEQLSLGEMSRVMAEQTLKSIGLAQETIDAMIEDALDGVPEPEGATA